MNAFHIQEKHLAVIHHCRRQLRIDWSNIPPVFNDVFFAERVESGQPLATEAQLHSAYMSRGHALDTVELDQPTLHAITDAVRRNRVRTYPVPAEASTGRVLERRTPTQRRIREAPAQRSLSTTLSGTQTTSNGISGGDSGQTSEVKKTGDNTAKGGKTGGQISSKVVLPAGEVIDLDTSDDEAQGGSNAGQGEDKLLMIHGSHFAVSWDLGTPYVTAAIPADTSSISEDGVFVPFDSAIYKRGGKVFGAIFATHAGPVQDDDEVRKDVMLCRAGECNICSPNIPQTALTSGPNGMPFVHTCCLDIMIGAHNLNCFAPKRDLMHDYAREYPRVTTEWVAFNNSDVLRAFVCVPGKCEFCKIVGRGGKVKKPLLLETERRLARYEQALEQVGQKDR